MASLFGKLGLGSVCGPERKNGAFFSVIGIVIDSSLQSVAVWAAKRILGNVTGLQIMDEIVEARKGLLLPQKRRAVDAALLNGFLLWYCILPSGC